MRFELPSDINKSLTDAGHTAVGFAATAAKRANDARLDTNARFQPQLVEARKRALELVENFDAARVRIESTVEPIVAAAVDRLPENVQDAVAEYRKVRVELVAKAHQNVVKAIEFATAVPVAPKAGTSRATTAKAKKAPKAAKAVRVTKKSLTVKPIAEKATRAAKATKATVTRRPRATAAA